MINKLSFLYVRATLYKGTGEPLKEGESLGLPKVVKMYLSFIVKGKGMNIHLKQLQLMDG